MNRRNNILFVGLTILTVALFVADLVVGSVAMPINEVWNALFGSSSQGSGTEVYATSSATSDYPKLLWLNPNSARTMEQLVAENPKLAGVDVVRKGRVYNCTAISTPAGGSDFWESGAVWADVVLADMITILHPERSGGHKMHYFENLTK